MLLPPELRSTRRCGQPKHVHAAATAVFCHCLGWSGTSRPSTCAGSNIVVPRCPGIHARPLPARFSATVPTSTSRAGLSSVVSTWDEAQAVRTCVAQTRLSETLTRMRAPLPQRSAHANAVRCPILPCRRHCPFHCQPILTLLSGTAAVLACSRVERRRRYLNGHAPAVAAGHTRRNATRGRRHRGNSLQVPLESSSLKHQFCLLPFAKLALLSLATAPFPSHWGPRKCRVDDTPTFSFWERGRWRYRRSPPPASVYAVQHRRCLRRRLKAACPA